MVHKKPVLRLQAVGRVPSGPMFAAGSATSAVSQKKLRVKS